MRGIFNRLICGFVTSALVFQALTVYAGEVKENTGNSTISINNKYENDGFSMSIENILELKSRLIFSKSGNWGSVVADNGSVYTWGCSDFGELGDGSITYGTNNHRDVPQKIIDNIKSIHGYNYGIMAISKNNELYGWGLNYQGILGDDFTGGDVIKSTPHKIMEDVYDFKNAESACGALKSNGDLFLWGNKWDCVIDDKLVYEFLAPICIMKNVILFDMGNGSASRTNFIAIDKNKNMYSWGGNNEYEIGNGNTQTQYVPIKIMENVKYACTHNGTTLAIKENGDLYSWGENKFGTAGNGNAKEQVTPVKILSNVEFVSMSDCNSLAITKDGDLYMWGLNSCGEIGNGEKLPDYDEYSSDASKSFVCSPTKILSDIIFADVSGGYNGATDNSVSWAITKSGTLLAWGNGEEKYLGDKIENGKKHEIITSPKEIIKDIKYALYGKNNCGAIISKKDELLTWGARKKGQLGDGNVNDSEYGYTDEPLRIMSVKGSGVVYNRSDNNNLDNNSDEETSPNTHLTNGLTLYPSGATTEAEIIRRINEIRTVFSGDKDGDCFYAKSKCTHGKGGYCENCEMQNVIPALGLGKALKKKKVYTCFGFAAFVYEYVFRKPFQDDASNHVVIGENGHKWDYDYVINNAKVGDVLRMKLSNGSPHFSIYMGADEVNKKVIVYESNGVAGWETNAVHYGADQHKIKTVSILRNKAYNMAINGTADKTIMVTIACPVDVEVYKDGVIIGRVKDNVVDEEVTAIDLYVYNEEKNFLLPYDEGYQIKLHAIDDGTMDYIVEEVGPGEDNKAKSFISVILTQGKLFESNTVADTAETKLYVVDSNGNRVSEVNEDGTENALDTSFLRTQTLSTKESKSFAVGEDIYTVSWNAFVPYDGRSHNASGVDESWIGKAYDTSKKVYDIKVLITKNGEIVDPSKYKVKVKNNKNASVSIDGIMTIQTNPNKLPSYTIKFKGKEYKDVNNKLSKERLYFGIIPAELKQDTVTFEKVTTRENGEIKIKKMTYKPEFVSGGSIPKPIKMKYKSKESKTDFITETVEDGSLNVIGKNNYYGCVKYKVQSGVY